MGVRQNFSRGGNVDIYPVWVAIDAVQMDVHKTFQPFYTTKTMPHVTTYGNSNKNALRWQP